MFDEFVQRVEAVSTKNGEPEPGRGRDGCGRGEIAGVGFAAERGQQKQFLEIARGAGERFELRPEISVVLEQQVFKRADVHRLAWVGVMDYGVGYAKRFFILSGNAGSCC
jgi:hypothetical protein